MMAIAVSFDDADSTIQTRTLKCIQAISQSWLMLENRQDAERMSSNGPPSAMAVQGRSQGRTKTSAKPEEA
jgi:hypothetical protein